MNKCFSHIVCLLASALGTTGFAWSQTMNLEQAITTARSNSVAAVEAKSSFVSSYWAWRSYQASRLPSLYLYGDFMNYDRSLSLLQDTDSGEMRYVSTDHLQNSLGLYLSQNITFTGGTLKLYSDLRRIDEYGSHNGKTWYTQPVSLSYTQPLWAYNQFKWDKKISPKEYEKAKRVYLESMEAVTLSSVKFFFDLMLARKNYDAAVSNYRNTSKMFDIAKQRVKLGSVTREDYLQLELRMLSDSTDMNDKDMAVKEAQMTLNSLLGLDEKAEVEPSVDEQLPAVMMDYDLVLSKSFENSSFNLGNEIDVLNAESEVAQAKARRGASVSLDATFGLSHSASAFDKAYGNLLDQEVVGLSFSIPIFDWGTGKGRVKKAEAAADVVKAQVRQAENDYRKSVFTAVGQFNNQRQQCYVSQRAMSISSERYSLMMEKFRGGSVSVTDLITSQNENDEAMGKYVTDLSNYWVYYFTLRKLALYDFISDSDLDVDYNEIVK
ncbi:MAG: TolC family protein [Bacteroidales bacterium]